MTLSLTSLPVTSWRLLTPRALWSTKNGWWAISVVLLATKNVVPKSNIKSIQIWRFQINVTKSWSSHSFHTLVNQYHDHSKLHHGSPNNRRKPHGICTSNEIKGQQCMASTIWHVYSDKGSVASVTRYKRPRADSSHGVSSMLFHHSPCQNLHWRNFTQAVRHLAWANRPTGTKRFLGNLRKS